jgi:hypothetical protein
VDIYQCVFKNCTIACCCCITDVAYSTECYSLLYYLMALQVEGENHMLTQQTVRHLLKAMTVKGSSSSSSNSSSSSVKSDSAYLRGWKQGSKYTAQSERDMQQLPLLHAAFRCSITHIYNACGHIYCSHHRMRKCLIASFCANDSTYQC